jgi:U3 small nucleolar ribonucleoprotein component
MGLLKIVRVGILLMLGASSLPALADKSLDEELDAEWGEKRVKTITVESPMDRYMARLKLIEGRRDDLTVRCKIRVESRNCVAEVEKDFRRDLRTLEKEFEDQIEELPKSRVKPKGFGHG